jgi:beta-galactosidase
VKDNTNAVVNMKLPGLVAKLCGVEVEEYISMPTDADNRIDFQGNSFTAAIWADVLAPQGSEVIARYMDDFYAGKPAGTLNKLGEGSVIYLGTLGEEAYFDTVADWVSNLAGITPLVDAPQGVEVAVRWHGDQQLLFLLNHTGEKQSVMLEDFYRDILNGTTYERVANLPPYGVMILTVNV